MSVWNESDFDARVGALAREDAAVSRMAALRQRYRAGLLTADEYIEACVQMAGDLSEASTPKVTTDDILDWSGQLLAEFDEPDEDDCEEFDDA